MPGVGRVEILYGGVWGTVCSNLWDISDADVVCRQLGYVGATMASSAVYEEGEGVTWMDEVSCSGNETRSDEFCIVICVTVRISNGNPGDFISFTLSRLLYHSPTDNLFEETSFSSPSFCCILYKKCCIVCRKTWGGSRGTKVVLKILAHSNWIHNCKNNSC